MYGLKEEIFNDIINVFKKYDSLEKVYLFGSRARGDYKDISDIDIAIDSKEDITFKILRDLDDLRCIHTFDVVNINLIGDKLKENIEKDKICIYERLACWQKIINDYNSGLSEVQFYEKDWRKKFEWYYLFKR